MRCAIIAAGQSQRLQAEGITVRKPLLTIGGTTLLERLHRLFTLAKAEAIVTLGYKNLESEIPTDLFQRLTEQNEPPHTFIFRDTVSPVESFHTLIPSLQGMPFCLTTVDTIFSETAFLHYATTLRKVLREGTADGVMGVTQLIADERPLYVATDGNNHITAFNDAPSDDAIYISAGVYGLSDRALTVLDDCYRRGCTRLRDFQRALLSSGLHLLAYDMGEVVDIDHKSDIALAEQLLKDKTWKYSQ